MADTTLKAIIDRIQAVCEASPLSLSKAKDAFSHDRQPNALLSNTYYLEDGGLVSSVDQGNNAEARIDAIDIHVAKKLAFDGTTALETMETTLLTLERYVLADGLSNSYHAHVANHKVSRPTGKDFLIGSLTINVDYDVSKAVA